VGAVALFKLSGQILLTDRRSHLILTLASSFLGYVYPALKSTRTKYMEQPLYSA